MVLVLFVALALGGPQVWFGREGRRAATRFHRALDVLGEMSGPARARGAAPDAPPPGERAPLVFTDASLAEPPAGDRRPSTPATRARGRLRSPRRGVLVAGLSLLCAAIAVGVIASLPTGPGRVRAGTSTTTAPGGPGTSTSPTTSTTTSTSTTTTLPVRSGTPVISALSPDTASAGQTITVIGSGIASANGRIVASFDGQVAPTRCPTEQRCEVVVPAGHATSATVVLETSSGRSNGLTFRYG